MTMRMISTPGELIADGFISDKFESLGKGVENIRSQGDMRRPSKCFNLRLFGFL